MKLLSKILLAVLLIMLYFAAPIIVLGQETEVGDQITQINFQESFGSAPALAAFVLIVTGWLAKLFEYFKWNLKFETINFLKDNKWKQYLSWLVGILLSAVGFFFQWGVFAGLQWYYIIIYGLTAALVANGLFKWDFLKSILEAIKVLPKQNVSETK